MQDVANSILDIHPILVDFYIVWVFVNVWSAAQFPNVTAESWVSGSLAEAESQYHPTQYKSVMLC